MDGTKSSAADAIRAAIRSVDRAPLLRALGEGFGAVRVRGWLRMGRVNPRHWAALNGALASLGGRAVPEETFRRAYEEPNADPRHGGPPGRGRTGPQSRHREVEP